MNKKIKIIVQFSGGKDSQACLIKACKDLRLRLLQEMTSIDRELLIWRIR